MLPSPGERLLWSAGGGSSWDTIFTSVVVPSSHLLVGVRNADVIFETATVFHQISHSLPSPCLFRPVLLTANLTDPEATTYRVKGYSEGTYKFVVKTYTAAGEETGATASITLEQYGM